MHHGVSTNLVNSFTVAIAVAAVGVETRGKE